MLKQISVKKNLTIVLMGSDVDTLVVQQFISTINPSLNLNSKNLFWPLVNAQVGVKDVLDFINICPYVLTMKIGRHYVFDYFYEKVISDRCHPVDSVGWHNALVDALQLLDALHDANVIKENKLYLLRLQSTTRSLTELFGYFIDYEFAIDDAKFLTYSVIARGELDKLVMLYKKYVIEGYGALLAVALRYGRSNIIGYLIDALDGLDTYGYIMDLPGFEENPRYMYYCEHIGKDNRDVVNMTNRNFKLSIEMLMNHYRYPITVKTIQRWCDIFRRDSDADATVIIPLLLRYTSELVPLITDFGEFNHLIFGHEWSDRKCLVERCLSLERQLSESIDRYDIIESHYRQLQNRS